MKKIVIVQRGHTSVYVDTAKHAAGRIAGYYQTTKQYGPNTSRLLTNSMVSPLLAIWFSALGILHKISSATANSQHLRGYLKARNKDFWRDFGRKSTLY